MNRDEDWESIIRFKDGDLAAFTELVERYEGVVFNCAFRIVGDREDAADVAQSVFLKLYQYLETVDTSRSFFSWLYRVAVNEAIDHTRKRRPHDTLDESAIASSTYNPVHHLDRDERDRALQRALDRLSDEQRAVVVLRHFSQLSYREVSEVLEIPETQVKSRLYAARQRLRELLIAAGEGY